MSSRPLSRRGGSLDLTSASSQEEKPPPAPPYAPTFNRKDVVYQVRELTIASVATRSSGTTAAGQSYVAGAMVRPAADSSVSPVDKRLSARPGAEQHAATDPAIGQSPDVRRAPVSTYSRQPRRRLETPET